MKSALLSAYCASKTFAPIEVPLLNNCLATTYFLLDSSNSQNFTISTEKSNDFSTIIFFCSITKNLMVNQYIKYN